MNRLKSLSIFVGGVAAMLICNAHAQAITFSVNEANQVLHADCVGPNQHTPGGTDLIPIDHALLSGATGNAITAALGNAFPTIGGNNATYTLSNTSLFGTLTVDWYKARDFHPGATPDICRHGAQLTMHYDIADGDPDNLDWIQLYTETGHSGNGTNTIDPQPADDTLPFYFTGADDRASFIHVPNPGGIIFGDSPSDPHDDHTTVSGSVTFTLVLAGWSNDNPENITLYDSVTWGYTYYCVPEPASLLVLGLGALGLLARRVRN